MKKLFSWKEDFRGGTLEGLFVATEEQLAKCLGKEIYLGEVLGKHSEVSVNFNREDFVVRSEDQEFINKLIQVMGSYDIAGYNPIVVYLDLLADDHYDEEG